MSNGSMSIRSVLKRAARRHHHRPRALVAGACAAVYPLGDQLEGPAQHPELRRGPDTVSGAGAVGLKLRGRVTVAEAEDVPPDGLRVNYHLVIEIEGGKKPACIAELIALHYR